MKNTAIFCTIFTLSGCTFSTHNDSNLTFEGTSDLNNAIVRVDIQEGNVTSSGSGTWLNDKYIITAAHLWNGVKPGYKLTVRYLSHVYPAKIYAIENPSNLDLAVLVVEPNNIIKSPEGWRVKLCDSMLSPAEPVWVASGMYNSISGSYASPDSIFLYKGRTGSHGLTGYYKEGVSGSSVFMRSENCMAGIVSMKDKSFDMISDVYKTDIVTVDMIRKFLHDNKIII
ncbi:serine protease [Rahnella sp. SL6]|uniref:serine protease n=1 Tax=Rahnella perminowiae TaxID=2816244 RepID=UPI001C2551D3|nr:serine protease [Rahnella perminowiae]MBU9809440.1 serine protease [Rahnella perminowiae]